MTLTLTLVRHGQTYLNARQLLQGSADSALTRSGLQGIRTTAQYLAAHRFDAVYSSPQGRAVTSAVELRRPHLELGDISIEAGLREYSFGLWERRPEAELEAAHPWAQLLPQILAGKHPGFARGEDAASFLKRIQASFDRIMDAHPSGEVLVVAHGLTLAAWMYTIDPDALMPLPNASISTVEVGPAGPIVIEVGLDPSRLTADAGYRVA